MEPIDEVLEAWFNEWWPEPSTTESNVVKKAQKNGLEALNSEDLPF